MNQTGDQAGGGLADGILDDPTARIKMMEAEHKEISGTVRRTMLALLGLELYCFVATFGISDVELIVSNSKINMPISGAQMSATGFMIGAPLILAVIVVYLHVFYGRLLQLDREIDGDPVLADAVRSGALIKAPGLFNFDGVIPHILTDFIFYWSCPIVLAAITFTLATPFPNYFRALIILTTLVAAAFLVVSFRRQDRRDPRKYIRGVRFAGWLGGLGLIGLMIFASLSTDSFTRSLSLERIDLSGQILRDRRLSGADLRDAKLADADLSGADLRSADLRGADLGKARLRGANLNGADLTGANLVGADLSAVDLSGARLKGNKLTSAVLRGANLTGADLSRADLSRTNFAGADLTAAVLSGATLYVVNFKDVTLRGAALNAVKYLRQSDLLNARASAPPTALPDHLTWPFVEKDGKWVLQEAN